MARLKGGSTIGGVQIASISYVRSQINTRLPLSGGTLTGDMTISKNAPILTMHDPRTDFIGSVAAQIKLTNGAGQNVIIEHDIVDSQILSSGQCIRIRSTDTTNHPISLEMEGQIAEDGTFLASKYLGISAKAASSSDSDSLGGVAATQYISGNKDNGAYQVSSEDARSLTENVFADINSTCTNKPSGETGWLWGWHMEHGNANGYGTTLVFGQGTNKLWWKTKETNVHSDWYEVFTTRSMGSGSGLDADTVDGIEGADLVNKDGSVAFTGAIQADAGLDQDGFTILNGTDTWLRTSGDTGLYCSTHQGGIYMIDNIYVQTYNSKKFKAPKVYGAVGNDYADAIEIDNEIEVEFGYCYVRDKNGFTRKSNKYAEKGIIGISTNTQSFTAHSYDSDIDFDAKRIPISVSGFVLVYIDKVYPSGTPLTCTKDGKITKANLFTRLFQSERIVGTFYKEITKDIWNEVKVDGRHLIKVR